MDNENYTVDKVVWHTQIPNNPEPTTRIYKRFWIVIKFLQQNHLCVESTIESEQDIKAETEIHTSNLTDEGKLVIKKYHKWLTSIDQGKSMEDLKIFERELSKIRNTKN
jgi:hypothetical protein